MVDTKVVLNSSNTWGRVGLSQPLNGALGSARTIFSLCIQQHFGLSLQLPFHLCSIAILSSDLLNQSQLNTI